MSLPSLLCKGAPIQVGARIGRGGEGEVYAIADGSGRAVKIYLNPDADRETKVSAIVAARLGDTCRNVAFPLDIVRFADRRFAGFTMRQVTGHQPIHELIAPGSRKHFFPNTDWRFLVRVALNVARIVANVHSAHVVIGDINSAGFLVSQQALVTLIDADSFQVGGHRCRVGMPEYTAPELQGVPFGTVDRTPDHDNFGLAVLVFQILALGRHPHSGITRGRPMPIESAIMQGRFAYSLLRDVGLMPPRGTLRLTDMPPGIRLLFERAFALRMGARPTAADWVRELSLLEDNLFPCPDRPHHFVATISTNCPWCRIEGHSGQALFSNGKAVITPIKSQPVTDIHREVDHAIRHAKSHAGEKIEPLWPRPTASPSKSAQKHGAAVKATSGSPCPPQVPQFRQSIPRAFFKAHAAAHSAVTQLLDPWRTKLGIWEVYKMSVALQDRLSRLDRLRSHETQFLERAKAHHIALKALHIMQNMRIDSAQIGGIGSAVRAQLASHGIVTAADINRPALAATAGLGEARTIALLLWRDMVAVEATHRVMRSGVSLETAIDAEKKRLDEQIAGEEAAIRLSLGDLRALVAQIRKKAAQPEPKIHAALCARDQAQADLDHLGVEPNLSALQIPAMPLAPAPKNPKQAPKAKVKKKASASKRQAKTCPRCASPMVKRWGSATHGSPTLFLGCSSYPRCNGSRPIRQKRASP